MNLISVGCMIISFLIKEIVPADTKASFRRRKDVFPSRLEDGFFSVCFEKFFGPKRGACKSTLKLLYCDANMIKKRPLSRL